MMKTMYSSYLALKFTDKWWNLTTDERSGAAAEVVKLFAEYADLVSLRGAYITQAFRADTDVFLWMFGEKVEDIQSIQLRLRKTLLGRCANTPWAFVGISQAAEFNQEHQPAFLRGVPAKTYLCFYPYIRTAEWYLLPAADRSVMLKEHGDVGREFEGVLTNGVYAFGLGDFEWLLSFEVDEPAKIMNAIRRLRETQARKFTKYEWPFIFGRHQDLKSALDQYI